MGKILGHRLTYPGKCYNCGQRVFMHTNGNGDWVILDELGPPWPIHAAITDEQLLQLTIEDTKTNGRCSCVSRGY